MDFNIQVTSFLDNAMSHEHIRLYGHSKGQVTIFWLVSALFTPSKTVIEFFLKSLKGNISLVPNSKGCGTLSFSCPMNSKCK